MIYFDYAATTPINPEILESYNELLKKYYANSASMHIMGAQVDSLQNRARKQIADLLGVKSEEIIFTSGASEANNTALKGVALRNQKKGKHIITTMVEHPSVLNTCKQLESLYGFEITYLPVNKEGKVELEVLEKAIRKDTILVSLIFVNNETGSINDIEGIGSFLKNNYPHIIFHTDATQGIGKFALNLRDIDLLSLSAHKLNGLKGSGLLVKKQEVKLEPLINGGDQEFGYRAGTSNWPVNVMLAKTLRFAFESKDQNYQIVKRYYDEIRAFLEAREDIQINSPKDGSPYILNFSLKNTKSAVVAGFLEKEGICVSTVSACSAHKALKSYVIEAIYQDEKRASSSLRISLSPLTTEDEIVLLLKALDKALKEIKR